MLGLEWGTLADRRVESEEKREGKTAPGVSGLRAAIGAHPRQRMTPNAFCASLVSHARYASRTP